jgi:hypothetical protein
MALPSSGQLSLNDIRVELQEAQANSSLGTLSNLAGFTDPDAVSDFYGYSYANYNTVSIINTQYFDSQDACDDTKDDDLTLYFSGTGGTPACPATGDTLYTNSALTTVFNGGSNWYRSNECMGAYFILPDGFVEGAADC